MDKKKNIKTESNITNSWWEEKKPILKLLGLFALGIITFLIITNLSFFQDVIYPKIIIVNASISSFILNILGYGTSSSGDSITSEFTSVSIKKGCDALAPVAIFGSVLLAYPAVIKPKIRAVVLGVLTLLGTNIIRIVSLFMFKVHAPHLFDVMHLVVWQGIFIFLALMLCFYWIKSFEPKAETDVETE